MALPPPAGRIEQRAANVRMLDPQSVTFKFKEKVGVAGFGATLKTLMIFDPQKTYALFGLRYSAIANGSGETALQVGFTNLPAGIGAAASLGVSMIDTLVVGPTLASESVFLNFYPYAWYLPVGKQVFISAVTNMPAMSLLRGSVQLYISETFEQG